MRREDLLIVGRAYAHSNLLNRALFLMVCEVLLAAYILTSVHYLDLSADPLRCIQHPRRDQAQFTALVLLPTVLLRMLFYGLSRRHNTYHTRICYGIANVW